MNFKAVSKADRKANLDELARKIDRWHKTRVHEGEPAPDGLVVLMPEGYGKSHLVLDLIERGFKVVFAAKSHGQLDEKEFGFRDLHGLKTHRTVSKRQNFRAHLELLGLSANRFKFVETQAANPYAPSEVSAPETTAALREFFDKHNLPYNADEFFNEHYQLFEPEDAIAAVDADVFLVTFAALQAATTSEHTQWWAKLGLIEKTKYKDPEEVEPIYHDDSANLTGEAREAVHFPHRKIVIVYDDPDRSDVDWMRRVSEKIAERLMLANVKRTTRRRKREVAASWVDHYPHLAKTLAAGQQQRNDEIRATPKHKLIEFKGSTYLERPLELTMGYGLHSRSSRPKIVITTTEWLTGYYALRTLNRSGLKAADHVDLFHTADCIVTAISTTITRKRNHAVLLPISEKLKQEFPDQNVSLIADGLGCELNLSNNKGRNDLATATTIIKLSWPHPSINSTIGAHFADVENPNYDLMIATQLADLGNQAIGRNQGFRFQGRQAIVLIDPKYFKVIAEQNLLRYKLTPWSSQLPNFNKKTTKKAALAALQFSNDQSPLEKRLIELIANFESFGLSDEAQSIAKKMPECQRAHYNEWLDMHGSSEALAAKAELAVALRAKTAEKVRRHREKKKAASKA
ncbi:hypothetical protein [Massilia sp. UYP32]|uniref:hypothetical protein n=1 Tax=Massilia sp. UYP32 TaxID=1756386 RepID=UPI003D19C9BE